MIINLLVLMKKDDDKVTKFGWFFLAGLCLLLVGAFFWKDFKWDGKKDVKIGIITDQKLSILIVSPDRNMINRLETTEKTPIWINGGYGWYEANKIKKLLQQEKKPNLAKEIFFYNFGVIPDKIEYQDSGVTMDILGIFGYLNFRINEENYLSNKEILTDNKEDNEVTLDDVAVRDLADSKVLAENIKVSVYNSSEQSGLAGFIGKRLDWMGLSVIATNNAADNTVTMCRIINGSEKINKLLKEIWNCEEVSDKSLNPDEMEIYFGEKFAKMLQY